MKTTLDVETRSTVDLKKVGAWRYAEDPTTEVMCLAYKMGKGRTWIWFPRKFSKLLPKGHALKSVQNHDQSVRKMVHQSDQFEAHNAEFERAIWHHIMHKRHGFPDLPLEKVYCTAARAAMHALPRDLFRAGRALGLDTQKDEAGHRVMLRMCKPRKPLKADLEEILAAGGNPDEITLWHEGAEDLIELGEYCIRDVDTESLLSDKMMDLPPKERRIWIMDQKINQRGLPVDLDSIEGIIDTVKTHSQKLRKEFKAIVPLAPAQIGAIIDWAATRGVMLSNLQKQTVIEALKSDLPPEVKRVLEIRQSLGRSATAKHDALLRTACGDGRVRGTMMYHGAGTGRWSGKYFQPHNLYRGDFKDFEVAIKLMMDGDLDGINLLYGDPMGVASTLVRPMVLASEGKDLIAADLAAIEARGLAWLAEEEATLEICRGDGKLYEAAAADVYGCDIEDIGKDSLERRIGKVVVLACGYQGHIGAFQSMAGTYGVYIPDDEAAKHVNAWRANNQNTVQLWYGLEEVCMNAVKDPSKVTEYNGIKFKVHKGFLLIRLPSGRFLYYCNPGTRYKELPVSGKIKEVVTYWAMNDKNQWAKTDTYGGKLTENVIQAMCRDILAEAMLRVEENERSPYELILHVHDELVVEVSEGQGSVEEVKMNLTINPPWALDLPIAAEGWRGKRYRK